MPIFLSCSIDNSIDNYCLDSEMYSDIQNNIPPFRLTGPPPSHPSPSSSTSPPSPSMHPRETVGSSRIKIKRSDRLDIPIETKDPIGSDGYGKGKGFAGPGSMLLRPRSSIYPYLLPPRSNVLIFTFTIPQYATTRCIFFIDNFRQLLFGFQNVFRD